MKKLAVLVAAGAIAGLIFAYREMSKEMEVEGEKPVFAPSRAKRGTDGEVVLTLDAETQKRIQLRVEPLVAATLSPEHVGFGRALDPTPLAALVAEMAATQIALTASSKEFERVKALRAEGENASARAVEAAEAAARRDRLAVRSIRDRLELAWGKAIARQPDLAGFVRSLVAQEAALVRVDLPAGERVHSSPAGARLVMLSEADPVAAQVLGAAPNANPEMQGEAFLLLVKPKPARLASGIAVTVHLQLSGEALRGVVVPREATLRAVGKAWVYVQTENERFARREIALDHPATNGWFVGSTVAPNDRVVVSGAQTLLSEELKSQIWLVE